MGSPNTSEKLMWVEFQKHQDQAVLHSVLLQAAQGRGPRAMSAVRILTRLHPLPGPEPPPDPQPLNVWTHGQV